MFRNGTSLFPPRDSDVLLLLRCHTCANKARPIPTGYWANPVVEQHKSLADFLASVRTPTDNPTNAGKQPDSSQQFDEYDYAILHMRTLLNLDRLQELGRVSEIIAQFYR